jgi:hypothetical protein
MVNMYSKGSRLGDLKNENISKVWLDQVSQPLVSICGPSRI